MAKHILLLAAGALSCVTLAAPVLAANIQLSTTRLQLAPDQPIGAITVHNNETAPLLLQAQMVRWTQHDGEDVFDETRDVLINPAVFRLDANANQILRVGLQVAQEPVERSYRLFLQEVPFQDVDAPGQVRTVLRISLPVFIPPKMGAHDTSRAGDAETEKTMSRDFRWRLEAGGPSPAHRGLFLRNAGNRHIQITELKLSGKDGSVLYQGHLSAYVLPGNELRLPVDLPSLHVGQRVRLSVLTDRGGATLNAELQVTNAGAYTP